MSAGGLRDKYKVLVQCMTYNHGPYILEALKSIASQKTAFPYLVVVMDDCSTDDTPEKIISFVNNECVIDSRKYKDNEDLVAFFAQSTANPHCRFLICLLKYNHYSEGIPKRQYFEEFLHVSQYVAFCEGDDYWLSSEKLQKQSDYLDAHENCALSVHQVLEHWDNLNMPDALFYPLEERDYSGDEICRNWIIQTGTYFCRRECLEDYDSTCSAAGVVFPFGDTPLALICERWGGIHAIPETMSVYRRHPESFTHCKSISHFYSTALEWHAIPVIINKRFRSIARRHEVFNYLRCFTAKTKTNTDVCLLIKAGNRMIRYPLTTVSVLVKIWQEKWAKK